MNRKLVVPAVLVLAALGLMLAWNHWSQPARVAPAPAKEEPFVTAAQSPVEPAIRHPVEQIQPAEEDPAPAGLGLPALDTSDPTLLEALAAVFGRPAVQQYFLPDGIVRRIVATVDNLPREKLARKVMPVRPLGGAFLTSGSPGAPEIAAANAVRYAPWVGLAEAADARRLVALYVRLYPLFQEAYRDLGYPKGHFNDRLVEVIDHLLATPELAGPVRLVQPRVLYEFADPVLESRSAGQKLLIRMGSGNATRVKAKLAELRALLAGEAPRS